MSKVTSAAIYARISSDPTGQRLGVERQLEDCRALARSRGWEVGEEYVDNDISAYRGARRPEYLRMLEDITEGSRDAVIVYNTDRLTRRPIELEEFVAICERAGLRQVATVTADIDLGNDDGMFMARILAAVAAKESGRKSERLKRKAREIAESGRPNGGNLRPFGYEKDRVTVVESEAEVIRQVSSRYLAGESLTSLTLWMQETGVLSVANKPWRTGTLRQLLTNPRIAGLRSHNGEVVTKAVWPAIITEDQHRQLVASFAQRKVTGRRSPRRYLLSGMLRCGKCGHTLYSSARGSTRRYVCSSSPDHGGCGRLTIVAAPVEEWLAHAVLMRLDTPAMSDMLAGRFAADERHGALLDELNQDRAHMDELAQLYAQREISAAEWKVAREPIQARILATERQLSKLSTNHTLDGIVGQGAQLQESWAELNLSRQAAIVAAVLDFATIGPGNSRSRMDPNRITPTWRV